MNFLIYLYLNALKEKNVRKVITGDGAAEIFAGYNFLIKKDHAELLSKNGLLDFEAGVSVTKSRFTVMKGDIAKLHRSLITFMLNTHTSKHKYCEYNVPYIVKDIELNICVLSRVYFC